MLGKRKVVRVLN